MKKLLALTLILALAMSMAGCCCLSTLTAPKKDTSASSGSLIEAIPDVMMPTEEENAALVEYIDANRDMILSSMEESFAGSSGMTCTSDIYVEGMGFVIVLNISEFDDLDDASKAMLQQIYDAMSGTFDSALATMQQELPDLEYFEIQICDTDGDLIATIVAGDK